MSKYNDNTNTTGL